MAIALRGGWDSDCPKGHIFAPQGRCANASTLAEHQRNMEELIARDKNRASVGIWSLSYAPFRSLLPLTLVLSFTSHRVRCPQERA